MDADDEFLDKAIEGAVLFALIREKSVHVLQDYWFRKILQMLSSKELSKE
jgi:hypothetical protein